MPMRRVERCYRRTEAKAADLAARFDSVLSKLALCDGFPDGALRSREGIVASVWVLLDNHSGFPGRRSIQASEPVKHRAGPQYSWL